MAKFELLFQAATKHSHASALKSLFGLPNINRSLISVAFARTAGVLELKEVIAAIPTKPQVFLGIRNDITSVQAVGLLLEYGVDLYLVDTGTRRPIFHPKVYLSANDKQAKAIIGSANLTHYGLWRNIELSTIIALDFSDDADKVFVESIFDAFQELKKDHPKHVIAVNSATQIEKLLSTGRLVDEKSISAPSFPQHSISKKQTELAPMTLFGIGATQKKTLAKKVSAEKQKLSEATKESVGKLHSDDAAFIKVWQSKPLIRRDLCIPKSTNTHLTGSMGLKQDALGKIDFHTYFRKIVFKELAWKADSKPEQEIVTAAFELVLGNINYGVFDLVLTHVTGSKAAALIKARNFVTGFRWGDAKPLIAKEYLLGRTLYLYKKATSPPIYLIEID